MGKFFANLRLSRYIRVKAKTRQEEIKTSLQGN